MLRNISLLRAARIVGCCFSWQKRGVSSTSSYDAIVVGGGHNGLVAAAYLAKAGKRVIVLEKRHVLGGAAVTEEIVPGFQFSRASYVYSLFRAHIAQDLQLFNRGLQLIPRSPSSFTPSAEVGGASLTLGGGDQYDFNEIAKFSKHDANAYMRYNKELEAYAAVFRPLLDAPAPDPVSWTHRTWGANNKWRDVKLGMQLTRSFSRHVGLMNLPRLSRFLFSPAATFLDEYFESDILKATLATDAVIGAMASPYTPQTTYVLLHHVLCGSWYNPKGGMGSVSRAIAEAGRSFGVEFRTNACVKQLLLDSSAQDQRVSRVAGVTLDNGEEIRAPCVVANLAPQLLFERLIPSTACLPDTFRKRISQTDNASGVVKINVALNALPTFRCQLPDGTNPLAHLQGTIHFEHHMKEIDTAYHEAALGRLPTKPFVEMTLPSVTDPSVAPPGKHVALLFTQYAPIAPVRESDGATLSWKDPAVRSTYAERVFNVIERFAPGFKSSIIDYDMLTPADLESIFSLPGGNISHSSLRMDQLLWDRPAAGFSQYRAPIEGLYMASAGCHPGGGVMGAAGHNAAMEILRDNNYTRAQLATISSAATL